MDWKVFVTIASLLFMNTSFKNQGLKRKIIKRKRVTGSRRRITPHLRDRWVFRYRKLSIHEERLYSSERTQLAFSATAQMRETLSNSARDRLQNRANRKNSKRKNDSLS